MTRQNEEIIGTMEQAPSVASNRGFNSLSSHAQNPQECHPNVPKRSFKRILNGRWYNMLGRCYDQRNQAYERYGGRGITVCDEWRNSLDTFRQWALANGFHPSLTLERKDNSLGYCPENCRFATAVEQQNNTRKNACYLFDGERLSVARAARKFGIRYGTLSTRIERAGFSIESELPPWVYSPRLNVRRPTALHIAIINACVMTTDTYKAIALQLGTSETTVGQTAKRHGISRIARRAAA